jgi:phage-related protein
VKDVIGVALDVAQQGEKHEAAKPLHGFGGSGVLEVIDDFDGDTYRAVYTVKFKGVVYALHSFQKKSKKGISTPKEEIDLVKKRLKAAEEHYKENYGRGQL